MPKQHSFEVEYAKSSMATCRVCMAKIPKGALRIGHVQVELPALENDVTAGLAKSATEVNNSSWPMLMQDKMMAYAAAATRWHHFECFPRMKGAKWMAANLPSDVNNIKGFSDVSKVDQKKICDLWKALFPDTSSSRGKASSSEDVLKKRPAAADLPSRSGKRTKMDDGSAKLSKFASVQGVLSAQNFHKISKLEMELSSRTGAQLGNELAKNDQVKTGKKEELVQRVAEGRVLGSLPNCPKCKKGKIHWSRIGGWYSCPGSFDPYRRNQMRCSFRSKQIKRGKWKKL